MIARIEKDITRGSNTWIEAGDYILHRWLDKSRLLIILYQDSLPHTRVLSVVNKADVELIYGS